jgi:hypothetical protein
VGPHQPCPFIYSARISLVNSIRPRLSAKLSPSEFAAWYWLKSELAEYCRRQGLPSSGRKEILHQRIAALLSGAECEPAKPRQSGRSKMPSSFTLSTRIGPGWRCSRELGNFFRVYCGRGFHFNAAVRDYVHNRIGARLAEAVRCYQQTAGSKPQIEPQFECNRHVREFYRANPAATKQQMLNAWWALRGKRKSR